MKTKLKYFLTTAALLSLLAGCSSGKGGDTKESGDQAKDASGNKNYTAFIAVPGTEVPDDSRLNEAFAKEFGWKVKVSWLTGQTAKERIGVMISGGDYPDVVDASEGRSAMIDAGAYVPLEDYLDDYPNLKGMLSDVDWEKIKKDNDGHIYTIPQFSAEKVKDMETEYGGEAFWIQKRVLAWANYPEITTLDEYFDLINSFLAANPETDGQKNIGFEILSDDWRYFCLENPPQFLAGYPNDGAAVVDPETKVAKVYDKLPEAKEYYQALSAQFEKGVIDPETFTAKYDQYIAKVSSGRVVGLIDQGWDFQSAEDSLVSQGKDELTYVPFDLVLDKNVTPQYGEHKSLTTQGGIGVTVDCKDVKGALQMFDDMVSEKGMILRNWGEKDVDYQIDGDGKFSRTDEQWKNWRNTDYVNKNSTAFGYMPGYGGMLPDGINTVSPAQQPEEFKKTLVDSDKAILEAYGVDNWNQMIKKQDPVQPWFPIYTERGKWTSKDEAAIANQNMQDVKMQWLPKVIMGGPDAFEKNWQDYMDTYESRINYKAFEDALTDEVARRIKVEAELQEVVDKTESTKESSSK